MFIRNSATIRLLKLIFQDIILLVKIKSLFSYFLLSLQLFLCPLYFLRLRIPAFYDALPHYTSFYTPSAISPCFSSTRKTNYNNLFKFSQTQICLFLTLQLFSSNNKNFIILSFYCPFSRL